jgi:hypothetical protein
VGFLRDKWDEASAQLNMWDGGKTAATVKAARKPAPATLPPKNTTVIGKRTVSTMAPEAKAKIQNAKYGVLAGNKQAQDSFINSTKVAPKPGVVSSIPGGFVQGLPTFGLAAARTGVGVAQDVSGLYDLASPGLGTNRFSKGLHTAAQGIDRTAQNMGVEGSYRMAQVPLNVSTFAAPGIGQANIATRMATAAPRLASAAGAVTGVLDKPVVAVTTRLAGQGRAGEIAAAGVRGAATAPMITNSAIGTGLDLGSESGKGRDISPLDVGIAAATNVGLSAALPAAGEIARPAVELGARIAEPTTRLVSKTTSKLRDAQRVAQQTNTERVRRQTAVAEAKKQVAIEEAKRERIPYGLANARANNAQDMKVDRAKATVELAERELKDFDKGRSTKDKIKDKFLGGGMGNSVGGPDALNKMYEKKHGNPKVEEYHNDYAGFLQDYDKQAPGGNKFKAEANGSPQMSGKSPFYRNFVAENGRNPNKSDYREEAIRQLKSGKADKFAQEEYDNLAKPDLNKIIDETNELSESPAPETKPSRFANRTVQKSDDVSTPLKELVKDEKVRYDTTTNAGRIAEAETQLKGKSGENNFNKVMRDLEDENPKGNGQSEVTAITLAKKLDAKGDEDSLFKSTEIYARLSERFSKSGQEVQAAALLASRTPAGLRYGAIRDLKKNGIDLSPERQKTIDDLVKGVEKAGDDVNAANLARYRLGKYVTDQLPTGVGQKLINIWRAGLLTAPTTTGGNILGNTGEAVVRKAWVNPLATAIDFGFGLKTGKRTMTLAPTGGFSKGAAEGTRKLPEFMKTGYDERNALSKYDTREIKYGDGPVGKLVGNYVNGVYRMMSLADQPFWYGARGEALSSIAKAEAITKGLKGDKQKAFIKSFMDNPPAIAIERATKEAKYATFQNKTALGEAASGLKKGLNKLPGGAAGDFFVPFSQVPSSIATRIVRRTPVGTAAEAVKQLIDVKKGGKFDQRAMSQAIAEGSFGPAVFAAGYTLANSGDITFGFPEDRKERELWEAEGKQPYSVRVGDRWYSLNYLQPFGTLLAVGGESANAIKEGAGAASTISRGIATAGQAMMNQSFLKGVSGVLDAIDDPKRYGEQFVSNTAGSVVPNMVRSFARASDAVQRETGGAITGIKQALPGLRQTTNEKLDMFGGVVPAKDNFANQFLNPLRPSKDRSGDPTTAELRRLYETDEGIIPSAAKTNSFKDVTLTKDQVRDINKEAGPALKTEYDKLIASNEYKGLSDEDKAGALKKVNSVVFGALKTKYGLDNSLIQEHDLNTNQKRYIEGKTVDFITDNDGPTYAEEYDEKLEDFKKDSNAWSTVKKAKKQREIDSLSVKKDFEKDIVDLYSMGKSDIYDLVSSDKDGNRIVEQLIKYGDALAAAGLGKNKLRNSKGGVAIKPSTGGSGGGRRSLADLSDIFSSLGGTNPHSYDKSLRKILANARLS